jgi:hypothetical protein
LTASRLEEGAVEHNIDTQKFAEIESWRNSGTSYTKLALPSPQKNSQSALLRRSDGGQTGTSVALHLKIAARARTTKAPMGEEMICGKGFIW